jgi:hypothetical protein
MAVQLAVETVVYLDELKAEWLAVLSAAKTAEHSAVWKVVR